MRKCCSFTATSATFSDIRWSDSPSWFQSNAPRMQRVHARKATSGCGELTPRDGKVVYDLNRMTREDWDRLPADYRSPGDSYWDAYAQPSRCTEPRRQASVAVRCD